MNFEGYEPITFEEFENVLKDNIDPNDPDKSQLMPEFKRKLKEYMMKHTDSFRRFEEENKDKIDKRGYIKTIIEQIREENKKEGKIGIGFEKLGGWYAGVDANGGLDTNIDFDNHGDIDKDEWRDLMEGGLWLGLNSIVGRKKDGSVVQAGSDPALCEYKDAKSFITSTYMEVKKWAVERKDGSWLLKGEETDARGYKLNEVGDIVEEQP